MNAFNDDALHPEDAEILTQLATSSDLDRPREQMHFLFFATEESSRQALAHAAEYDWEAYGEIQKANGAAGKPPTHPWGTSVRRTDLATNPETIPAIRSFFEDLCIKFDGRYDGWETVTDDQTDDAITMEDLTDEELEFLVKLRELAKKVDIAEDLDAIQSLFAEQRAAWHAATPKQRFEADAIIHALGVACGDILAGKLDLRWARLTDRHGTDFALVSELGDASGITVFPINAVSTRWDDPTKPGLDEYVADVLGWAEEYE